MKLPEKMVPITLSEKEYFCITYYLGKYLPFDNEAQQLLKRFIILGSEAGMYDESDRFDYIGQEEF